MPSSAEYQAWLDKNPDKKGTPDYEKIVFAYGKAKERETQTTMPEPVIRDPNKTEGTRAVERLQANGVADNAILDWVKGQKYLATQEGKSEDQFKEEMFGIKPFNTKALEDYFNKALSEGKAARQGEGEQKPYSIMDALDDGWGASVTGLGARQKLPDALPQDASTLESLSYGLGMAAGDLPAMIGGFFAGGGPVSPITAGAGAYALPAAMRAAYIDNLQYGEFKNPKDFLNRAQGVFLETGKAYVTGAVATGAGLAVGAKLPVATTIAGSTARTLAIGTTEALTATAVTGALEGQLPTTEDFFNAAATVFALGSIGYTVKQSPVVVKKIQNIYAKTGLRPEEVALDAKLNPEIRADLMSKDAEIPRAYQDAVDPLFAPKEKPAPSLTEPKPTFFSNMKSTIATYRNKGYAEIVDAFDPIKTYVKEAEKVTGKTLPQEKDPFVLARLSKGFVGKAKHFLEYGTFYYGTLENRGKSFKEIISPLVRKNELQDFVDYVISARGKELENRGIETGLGADKIDETLARHGDKYKKTAEDLYTFQNELTEYLRDSGILSEKEYAAMLAANKYYVPYHRLLEEESGMGTGGQGLEAWNPLKAIKGSKLEIVDPIESIIKNVYAYLALAEKNRAASAFIDLATQFSDSNWKMTPDGQAVDVSRLRIQKKETPVRPVDIKDEEMVAFLKQQGVPDDVIDAMDTSGLTVFRAMREPLADNEISVMRNGKREVYILDPELAAAFKATNLETMSLFFRLTAIPARLSRAGITLAPQFPLLNFIRDQFDAYINSKTGYNPFVSAVSGLISLSKKDSYYKETLKSSGFQASLVSLDMNYIKNDLFDIKNKSGVVGHAWNVVKSPMDYFRMLSEMSEQVTRLGEAKRMLKRTEGLPSITKYTEVGYASREVLPDLMQSGRNKTLKQWAAQTAFLNASIQGIDRMTRQWRQNPERTIMRGVTAITVPSVVLWYVNHKDPRYMNAPDWQKNLFWIIPTDDWQPATDYETDYPAYLKRNNNGVLEVNKGVVFKIPKPREYGIIFGSSVERMLDNLYAEDQNLTSALDALLESFMPPVIPTAVKPIWEETTNKSMFTGGPLVAPNVESAGPEVQYGNYTTELTKWFGGVLAQFPFLYSSKPGAHTISPAVMENYIRQWTGTLGVMALKLSDFALRKAELLPDPPKPEWTLADIPIIQAFIVRNPSAQAGPIIQFYDGFTKRQQIINTYNYYENNEPEKLEAFFKKYPKNVLANAVEAREALTSQQQAIRNIWKNPNIDPREKRQIIENMYYGMVEVAKHGNQQLKEMDKWAAENPAPSD
jgi:hypothetical protein